MRKVKRGGHGFTLLEMLVALALFSLLLLGFGSVFQRLEQTGDVISGIERNEEVEVVRHFIRQSLEGSRALTRTSSQGARTVDFKGAPARLVLSEVADGSRMVGGIYEAEISLDKDGQLMHVRRPLGWGQPGDVEQTVLLRNVQAISFSYFPCPSDPPGNDIHRWPKTDHLPFRITLALTFATGDSRRWTDLSAILPAANCPAGG